MEEDPVYSEGSREEKPLRRAVVDSYEVEETKPEGEVVGEGVSGRPTDVEEDEPEDRPVDVEEDGPEDEPVDVEEDDPDDVGEDDPEDELGREMDRWLGVNEQFSWQGLRVLPIEFNDDIEVFKVRGKVPSERKVGLVGDGRDSGGGREGEGGEQLGEAEKPKKGCVGGREGVRGSGNSRGDEKDGRGGN